MKTQLSIFAGLFFMSLITFGQKVNLVIFAEDGDKFYAYINGIKQNNVAESNVKVTDVTPNISLRIEFEDKALPILKQTMALEAGFEHTAKIKRDMKKQMKLRYFGSVPLNEAASNGASTVPYHTAETTGNNYNTSTTNDNSNTTVTTTTRTSTANSTTNPNNAGVSISMNGTGINMNVTGMDMEGTSNVHSSTSTTVTTTTSSSNSSPKNNTSYTETQSSTGSGCRAAMTQTSFDSMKKSVESKPFSDTKMSTAKVATKNNCVSANQVKEICKLFSMDDDKLTYAKFAYDYCVDKGNYYQVSEVFSFSSTTDELNTFLEKH